MKVNKEDLLEKQCKDMWKEEAQRLQKILHRVQFQGRTCRVPNGKHGNTIRFGIISDIHFGQESCRPDLVRIALKSLFLEGFKDVICAGDILDGHGMYKGQEFEQKATGFDKQCRYMGQTLRDLPRFDTIRFITGSHDLSYQKKNGISVGSELEHKFGWSFVGDESGSIIYETSNGPYQVDVVHPGGGCAYALSYKPQKMIDSMAGGRKPNMLINGHFHKAEHIPGYRNVDSIQAGCLEAQSPFMKRMGLSAMMGYWMIEIVVGKPNDLCNRVKAEFVSFYEG